MDHPDESMLLAATRQQPDGWPGGIEQHITQCSICHDRYREYQRINEILVDWAHAPIYRTYPSITASVMQKLHEPEPSSGHLARFLKAVRKGYRGATLPSSRLVGPVVVAVAVVLCTLVVSALATSTYLHVPASTFGYLTESKPTATVGPQKVQLKPTHIAVVATATQQVTTGGSLTGRPSLAVCSSPADVEQNRLRVCGHNFKPVNLVVLVIKIHGSRPKVLKPVLVQSDGTMQNWFFVRSCDALPSAIAAQYDDTTVVLTTLENFQFAGCNGQSYTSP